MTDQTDLQGRQALAPSENVVVDLNEYRHVKDPLPVTFHRRELDQILWVYGRMVGEGEWRDYALDHMRDKAVFSVFKRSGEMPLYRVEKVPKLAAKQGAYAVVNTHGMILKRGHELPQVLKVFDKLLKVVKS
ncbi:hypothetical protein ASG25_18580 [Rhizobium sp. Leaf384]|uniref:DUF2794 domain-containing protein n=1 Tax=unclassified Rhizobium TaxID=2613769 RepID=UPI000715AB21|nr:MULTISPECIES: DUF2794 domain-containing protein [unclassified Rhizobium]KQR79422.1 hypothetical protein ASG03_11700 [Rhizobium sp. Leaf341]KQS76218.1 hypothetical protein ASG25_18580 [Rhizobium sp. Leaf384]KQS78645.1 hypothetical protein ASG58_09250 [Rhizobium sp. Leaf383]